MVIFLDIDGVLNKKSQWQHMFSLDAVCIKEFCTFAKKINAEIVLTSTWKNGYMGWMNKNNSTPIKKLESYLDAYGLKITGSTPNLKGRTRDKEIERYIYLNDIHEYIVIDDDKSLFWDINRHYYFTDSVYGFTKKDSRGCMKCI